MAEKRQLADALDFDEALALLESQYQTDPVNPEDDRNGLSARHLCPVCPAGVRVLAVGSKSGARPQGCCTRRKTVTARRTRTKIVTKWTSLPTKVRFGRKLVLRRRGLRSFYRATTLTLSPTRVLRNTRSLPYRAASISTLTRTAFSLLASMFPSVFGPSHSRLLPLPVPARVLPLARQTR